MNDLEQRLKDVLESDASKAPRVARAPEGLKRDVRRRQVGTALIGTFATGGPQFLGVNVLSFIGFVLSGILGVWLLWAVVRRGRL